MFLYRVCSPLSQYRKIVLICSASTNALALIITAIVSYAANITEPVLKIPYLDMGGVSYLTTVIIIAIFAAVYLFVYKIVEIHKGDKTENEN